MLCESKIYKKKNVMMIALKEFHLSKWINCFMMVYHMMMLLLTYRLHKRIVTCYVMLYTSEDDF